MNEFKKEILKQLDNETDILIFSNGKLHGCIGDINLIVQQIANMIYDLSQQSGVRKKEIMKVIREMLKELNQNDNSK